MKERLPSIDLLRGLAVALMAIDHTRDYFSNCLYFSPTDLDRTSPALFFTRWITHLCAPIFILLAGTGAFLHQAKINSKAAIAKFLVLRGLWLVLLELTVVRLGFYFTLDFRDLQGLVIWTLGWCMVLLAGLLYLPRVALLTISLLMIFTHNLFDNVPPAAFAPFDWLWIVLHAHASIPLGGGVMLYPPYKIIPWIGVMGLGYCLGSVFQKPRAERRSFFRKWGIVTCVLFIVCRGWLVFQAAPSWALHEFSMKELMAFLNNEKYPPSLEYLLMTLGPAFLLLAVCDREPGWLGRRLIAFGRVPLFFYLLHLPLIHGLAVAINWFDTGSVAPWLQSPPAQAQAPFGYGYSLPVVYLVWLVVLMILYPLCVWFAKLKKRHPGGLLSYL